LRWTLIKILKVSYIWSIQTANDGDNHGYPNHGFFYFLIEDMLSGDGLKGEIYAIPAEINGEALKVSVDGRSKESGSSGLNNQGFLEARGDARSRGELAWTAASWDRIPNPFLQNY
jgi:hypothetical protein